MTRVELLEGRALFASYAAGNATELIAATRAGNSTEADTRRGQDRAADRAGHRRLADVADRHSEGGRAQGGPAGDAVGVRRGGAGRRRGGGGRRLLRVRTPEATSPAPGRIGQ